MLDLTKVQSPEYLITYLVENNEVAVTEALKKHGFSFSYSTPQELIGYCLALLATGCDLTFLGNVPVPGPADQQGTKGGGMGKFSWADLGQYLATAGLVIASILGGSATSQTPPPAITEPTILGMKQTTFIVLAVGVIVMILLFVILKRK
jgi:hypothetical protein